MFNLSQNKAIRHLEGPALVLAGPGSGKTTVITQRIRNLINNAGVSPDKILVVTFTKAAALEMEQRFKSLMNKDGRVEHSYPVTFGTFHSVYFRILRQACNYSGESIVSDKQQHDFIREIAIRLKIDINSMEDFIQSAKGEISNIKGNGINLFEYYPKCCTPEEFQKVFNEYSKALEAERKIDFDDMVGKCYEILKQRADILNMWKEKFQYILIDEFQDINHLQYETIKLLAKPQDNIFIVGDDDQSIYGFRGACPEIMMNFKEYYCDAKQILLDINYRSVPNIVRLSQNLIEHNTNRFHKSIQPKKKNNQDVDIRKFQNQGQELKYVSNKIKAYVKQGIKLKDMAILLRNNSQSGPIGDFLENERLAFKTQKGSNNIYDSMVAKDILEYIRAALFNQTLPIRENSHLIYVLNKPSRFISRQVVGQNDVNFDELKDIYRHSPEVLNNISGLQFHLEMIAKLNPYAALLYIRNGVGYERYLRAYSKEHNVKLPNLLKQLDILQATASKFQTHKQWFEHIEEQQNKKEQKDTEGINIITMHCSKGLEFPVVFILDANQGIIPSSKAVRDREFEEERRVFYVAVTRATKYLNIYAVAESLGCPVEQSMFINELLESKVRGID